MIELISIGDEVLYGYTINTNASFLSKLLVEAGFLPSRQTVVGDDEELLKATLKDALQRNALVIVTGGLGPTLDDKTRKVISDLFQVPLVLNVEVLKKLENRFPQYSKQAAFQDQATLPAQAEIIENEIGSASGFLIQNKSIFPNASLIALPGVPLELKRMCEKSFLPLVQKSVQKQKQIFCKTLHFALLSETLFDPILRAIEKAYPGIRCGIYPAQSSITIHLKAHAENESAFQKMLQEPLKLFEPFQENAYESPTGTIEEALHNLLLEKKITLSFAESCTGGRIASKLVLNPNASSYFHGAIVAYDNVAKTNLLQVPSKLIQEKGAVSEEVALHMAKGARQAFNTVCSLAVTGIAGPSGGSLEKPVGTICFAISYADTPAFAWTMHFSGNRRFIIEKATQLAFAKLYLFLRRLGDTPVFTKK